MNIPKYVQEIVSRSRYDFDVCRNHSLYAPGYTIEIAKATHYTHAATLHNEVARLIRWANRISGDGTAMLLKAPAKTTHSMQYAYVTIFDPVMQQIERYLKQ